MIERGRICWLEGAKSVSRQAVLVIQSNAFNRSRIPTVLVAPLAQDLRLAEAPGNLLVPARHSGLGRDTVLLVSELATLERRQLRETAARLDPSVMAGVDEGLRLVLGLAPT